MREQLLFNLAHRPALGRQDFLCAPCNADALALIDDYTTWQHHVTVIYGASASGKTHLAAVFCAQSGAQYICADELPAANLIDISELSDMLSPNGLVVDGLENLAPHAEITLFHLINLAQEWHYPLLLLSQIAPSQLEIRLADLDSRLRALVPCMLAPPDDTLLSNLTRKLFRDRQLEIPPPVLAFMLPRMRRDFASVAELVAAIDYASLQHRRALSIPLVAQVLRSL